MMRKIKLVTTAAAVCTAITATAVFAQSMKVVGLDGKTVVLQ